MIDPKNPPVWLYHETDPDLIPDIMKNGLIPHKSVNTSCEGYVCKIIDDHLPIRKNSVYFRTLPRKVPKDCYYEKDEWLKEEIKSKIKVRADNIPCECMAVNSDYAGTMFSEIEYPAHSIAYKKALSYAFERAMERAGFEGTQEEYIRESGVDWMDLIDWDKDYHPLKEKEKMKQIKRLSKPNKLTGDFWYNKMKWLEELKPLERHDYGIEVMCPCEIPPHILVYL